jgi:hypothetical protein
MKSGTLFFVLLVFVAGLSCRKENMCDCIKRTGEIITETRTLPPFDRVLAHDNVHVYITQDTLFEVKVEAGENIVPLIRTEVIDGEIQIHNDNRCNWSRSYKPQIIVHIKMPQLRYVTSATVGLIKSTNTITAPIFDYRLKSLGDIDITVNSNDVFGHMHGAGDIYLRGTTDHHACNIVGNGFIHARDLATEYTWIYSNTTGLAYINVKNLLQVQILGSGDIIYTGQPNTIEKKITGTGRLIPQ